MDIKHEIGLLSRIKDVLDELNIMKMIFEDQHKVLRIMNDIVRPINKSTQSPSQIARSPSLRSVSSSTKDEDKIYAWQHGSDSGTTSNMASKASSAVRPNQETKDDRDDFSMPLTTVKAGSDEIGAMIERAENAKQAVCVHHCACLVINSRLQLTFLVDLKQKQNDVIDSKTSLEQGRVVLVFTITTIIFVRTPSFIMTNIISDSL